MAARLIFALFLLVNLFFITPVQAIVELPDDLEELSGILDVEIFDDFETKTSKTIVHLKPFNQPDKRIYLKAPELVFKNLTTGDHVSVYVEKKKKTALHSQDIKKYGADLNEEIATVHGNIKILKKAFELKAPNNRKVAYFIVDLIDANASNDITPQNLAPFLDDLKSEYAKDSFNKLNLVHDANRDGKHDAYTYSLNERQSSCDRYGWARRVLDKARADGVNLDLYQHRVFIFSKNLNCGWIGIANLGCNNTCMAWIKKADSIQLYIHELGHNIGLHHASTDPDDNGLVNSEYGDTSSPMGYTTRDNKFFNAPQMAAMGWHNPLNVSFSQKIRLAPVDVLNASLPQVIKLKRSDRDYYYLSYRKRSSRDVVPSSYTTGINVHSHTGNGRNRSHFINILADSNTWGNPNFKVTQTARTDDYVDLQIDFKCSGYSWATLKSGIMAIPANSKGINNIIIINKDQDLSCPEQKYRINITDSNGITVIPEQSEVVLASNKRVLVPLNITNNLTSGAGYYKVSIEHQLPDGSWRNIAMMQGKVWTEENLVMSPEIPTDVYTGTWTKIPDFSVLNADSRVFMEKVDLLPWAGKNNFGLDFFGAIKIDKEDYYTFYLLSDDGSRLTIAGQTVIDNDGVHNAIEKTGGIYLAPGYYPVRIEYFQNTATSQLGLFYSTSTIEKREVPFNMYYHHTYEKDNQPPIADAGGDQSILESVYHHVIGKGADIDGTIVNYKWEKVSGPELDMVDPSKPELVLKNLKEGNYILKLTVTDNDGATGSDTMELSVYKVNVPPVVNAGPDMTVSLQDGVVQLLAEANDPDGAIVAVNWELLSGPGYGFRKQNFSAAQLSFNFMPWAVGVYEFKVTVEDNSGATASDNMLLTVTD